MIDSSQGSEVSRSTASLDKKAVASQEVDSKPLSGFEFVFDAASAVGTIVVALLAIFGDRIRAFLARPQIVIEAKKNAPHVEIEHESVSMQSDQSVVLECLKIRLCVKNKGRSIARSSRLVVDRIYRTRANDPGLHEEEIRPRVIPWPDDEKPIDLVPNFPYFVDVAWVKQDEQEGSVDSQSAQVAPAYKLYLTFLRNSSNRTVSEFFHVGSGRVLFKLTVFSENSRRPVVYFVSIYWSGTSPANHKQNGVFDIEALTEAEAKKKHKEIK